VLLRTAHKTPIGTLTVIAREHIVLAAGFGGYEAMVRGMDTEDSSLKLSKADRIPMISDLIEDYFDGDLHAFNSIVVRQPGEKFSQAAWKAMQKVAPGKVISYADLAAKAGSPDAVRAAGSACARNLIAPIIPCHRIVRSGGALGNYAYGLPAKEWLLRHEGFLK
jgi:methylated-DNA-[protein]-cysteine S-methyltransferase